MLTNYEHETVRQLAVVWNRISILTGVDISRQADMVEVAFHIHALQKLVLAQAAARQYPDMYRLLGEQLPQFTESDEDYYYGQDVEDDV